MTILVCDDDKEIVEAIEIYLLQEGFSVEKAYDGEQALSMIEFSTQDQWRRDAAWIVTAIDPCVPYQIRFHNDTNDTE